MVANGVFSLCTLETVLMDHNTLKERPILSEKNDAERMNSSLVILSEASAGAAMVLENKNV